MPPFLKLILQKFFCNRFHLFLISCLNRQARKQTLYSHWLLVWVTAHKSVQAVWPWDRGKCVVYICNKSLWPLKFSGHCRYYIEPGESHRVTTDLYFILFFFLVLSTFSLCPLIHTPVKTSKHHFASFNDRNWSLADVGYRGLLSEMTISQSIKLILLRFSKGFRHQQV